MRENGAVLSGLTQTSHSTRRLRAGLSNAAPFGAEI